MDIFPGDHTKEEALILMTQLELLVGPFVDLLSRLVIFKNGLFFKFLS